jgi:ABC-type sugar transport system substrate-binding protein
VSTHKRQSIKLSKEEENIMHKLQIFHAKWFGLLIGLLLLSLVATACGGQPTAAPEPTKAPEPTAVQPAEEEPAAAAEAPEGMIDTEDLTLGVIYLTLEHPYYQAHSGHTQRYAEELGLTLVEIVMASAMEDLIAQGVDGIIFCLIDPAAAVPSIEEAQAADIPVVTFASGVGSHRSSRSRGGQAFPRDFRC